MDKAMKTIIVMALLFAGSAFGQSDRPKTPPADGDFKYQSNTISPGLQDSETMGNQGIDSELIDFGAPQFLEIDGKNGMLVQISLADGSITYGEHYKLDAAAKVFWDAVSMYFPLRQCPPKEEKPVRTVAEP